MIDIKWNNSLARLISYITFDGHLSKDLKCFYLSSKNKELLMDFENIVYKTFKIKGKIEKGTGYGESYKYRVLNKKAGVFLEGVGVPKGNKVNQSFLIPRWIKDDKEFCREYLRVAFDCEGSIWFEKQPKIRFGICKSEEFIDNGFNFLEEMRAIMLKFKIESTKPWSIKANDKKDGKSTKEIYFKIKQGSIKQFSEEIGFSDRFKKQRLSSV